MFNFNEITFDINNSFFQDYLRSLSNVYDDFLEEHILESKFYSVYLENQIGYFAIYDNKMLTQFFIEDKNYHYAQLILNKVIDKFEVKNAFIPTCDEKFLSLALDKHKQVKLQAYFFQRVHYIEPKYDESLFKLATLNDLDEIIEKTEDFVDKHEERIKNQELYILKDKEEFLGLGLISKNVIMNKSNGIGMFTYPSCRRQGVGTSIIIHLANIVEKNNCTPIPGCWYYNTNSKKTLEKAGFISKTRLLVIEF